MYEERGKGGSDRQREGGEGGGGVRETERWEREIREFSPISLSQRDERVVIDNSTNFFGLKRSLSQRDERVVIDNSTNFFGLKRSVAIC